MVEALVGAYLIGGGPSAADALLAYLHLPRPCHCPSPRTTLTPPTGGTGHNAAPWPLRHRACDCWCVYHIQQHEQIDTCHVADHGTRAPIFNSRPRCFLPTRRPSSLGLPPACPCPSGAALYRVREVEGRLGYRFKNQWLAVAALTHPSYPKRQWPSSARALVSVGDYQRLEFLGDSLLDYVIVVAGYFTQQVHGHYHTGRANIWAAHLQGGTKYRERSCVCLWSALLLGRSREAKEASGTPRGSSTRSTSWYVRLPSFDH